MVLSISGRIEANELLELQKAVPSEETARQTVELDLDNLKLVDQQAVTFLAFCEAGGIRLRNCPAYIREWIEEKKLGRVSAVSGNRKLKGLCI